MSLGNDDDNYAIDNNVKPGAPKQCISYLKTNPCGQNAAWWAMNRELEMGYACNLHLAFMLEYVRNGHDPVFTVGRMT